MSNETQAQEIKDVTVANPVLPPAVKSMADDEELLISMIKLPSLFLCQAGTKAVKNKLAQEGDFFENLQNRVVATKGTPLSFVPVKIRNVITTYKVVGTEKEFVERKPRTRENEQKEWDEIREEKDAKGKKINVAYRHLPETQAYVLELEELKSGLALPMVFTFRGASMPKGGKSIYTQAMLLKSSDLPLYSYIFKMTGSEESKDDKTFQVTQVERTNEKTTAEQRAICEKWLATINGMSVEIVEEALPEEEGKPKAEVVERF